MNWNFTAIFEYSLIQGGEAEYSTLEGPEMKSFPVQVYGDDRKLKDLQDGISPGALEAGGIASVTGMT